MLALEFEFAILLTFVLSSLLSSDFKFRSLRGVGTLFL